MNQHLAPSELYRESSSMGGGDIIERGSSSDQQQDDEGEMGSGDMGDSHEVPAEDNIELE